MPLIEKVELRTMLGINENIVIGKKKTTLNSLHTISPGELIDSNLHITVQLIYRTLFYPRPQYALYIDWNTPPSRTSQLRVIQMHRLKKRFLLISQLKLRVHLIHQMK